MPFSSTSNGSKKIGFIAGGVLAVLLIGYFSSYAVLSWLSWGYHNPVTPAGYVGYVTKGAVVGKTEFVKIQEGPTSPGSGWMLYVINIPRRHVTYGEDFLGGNAIVASDNNPIQFRLNVMWRVRPGEANYKTFVEKYSTLKTDDKGDQIMATAYNNFLRNKIRDFVIQAVSSRKGRAVEIQDQLPQIATEVFNRVTEFTASTPFEVKEIATGAIHYPDQVTDQVAKKMAKQALLDQRRTEVQIQDKDNQIRVLDAQALAESADIINRTLNDPYLQHLSLQVMKAHMEGKDQTHIYMEVGPMGVPVAPGQKK